MTANTTHLDHLSTAVAGRYTIERELGRGGMATVYLAQDLRHKRRVALKVLDPELGLVVGGERFRREIEMAAELQHPHVLPVFDSGEAGTALWYTMPYVEGESLRERIRREGRLPVAEALRLAREIAEALNYAHRRGVIHRDIKPGNILLSEGHALVADFGIARQGSKVALGVESAVDTLLADVGLTEIGLADSLTGATLTSTGLSLGTPAYMSPEQALGARDVDGRSDQYAVACVLYEMLTGAPPYAGDSARALIGQHLTAPVPNVRAERPEVSQPVNAVLAKALAKTPDARFATAAEFAIALERATPAPSAGALSRYMSRRGLVAVTGAILAAAAIGGTALLRSRGTAPLNQHLVAVAPFEVLVPELAAWRERMIDQLSRSIDGAGPLRAVPTSTALQRWRGRADLAGAVAFGHRTGAGLVVYGELDRTGGDSVTLSANLVDAGTGKVIAQTRRADVGARVDRAADQLTVAILRQAASSQGIRRAGQRGFESRSPAAMRAALAGEQFYRRAMWDSAIVRYKEAIELDSGFTLAQGRVGRVLAWHGDEDPHPFLARAAHTPGLSWLDSMLITADSISAALRRGQTQPGPSAAVSLLLTLDEAVWQEQGRSDAEAWYELGEGRYHWGGTVGMSPAEALHAFERAIALDSGFAPAYIHSIELQLHQGDPAGALRYFDRLRALGTTMEPGTTTQGQRYLLRAAVQGAPVEPDSVSREDLRAVGMFSRWPDSGQTTHSMARALLRKAEAAWSATGGDEDPAAFPASKDMSLAVQVLAYLGHLAEADSNRVVDGLPSFGDLPVLMEAVLLGAASAERVDKDLRSFGSTPDRDPRNQLLPRWYGVRGDTAALRTILDRARRIGVGASLVPRSIVTDASAYLALARHDTTGALRAFETLTDSLEHGLTVDHLQRARLLAATGKLDVARRQYSHAGGGDGPLSVVARLELAELAERQGAREQALESYRFVAAIWNHADPVLQPYVARARAGLARLAAKPRS
jgi:serine/threonine-protein kinase